jgi:cellulose synthase/poly-beta-1,6-N-acetylglucosamine synthase-like glycosyltransferase
MSALALLCVALLAYTYAGYPVLIGIFARLFRTRAQAPADELDATPMVSICLPVFNAASYLPAKLKSLLEQDYPAERIEILVYFDGCTDDSEAVARAIADAPEAGGRIRIFPSADRRGKPTALNTLGPAATGEVLLLNDVRQPLSPDAVRALVQSMRDPKVGCATGNLVLSGGAGSGVYWRYENWIRAQESGFRGTVGMTGPIAMIRRADLEPLPEDLILDDVWIPMRLALAGQRVALVSEARAYDAAFEDDREFRRKVRTLAGNYQIFARLPALLNPFANPIWFETISHKIMRLAAPWLLLILAATSTAAALDSPGPWTSIMRVLVVLQALFYAASALGPAGGRLAGVARTFVVLNVAAVVGLGRFLTGRQRITW